MLNIIKADVYRIVRGKGLYITLAVFLFLVVMQSVADDGVYIGVNFESANALHDIDLSAVEEYHSEGMFLAPTGVNAPAKIMPSIDSLLYFLLPLLTFLTVIDFSAGTAKNTLASGISRSKYYTAKLLLSCIMTTLLYAIYILVPTVLATALNGFGGTFGWAFVSGVMKVSLPQLFLCLAATCVANFFIFALRSAAYVGVYIAFLLGPTIATLLLVMISDWFYRLFDYDLVMNIGKIVYIDLLTSGEIAKIYIVGAGYLLLSVFGGFAIFKRAEIK